MDLSEARLLIVAEDDTTIASLTECLVMRFDADVAIVGCIADAQAMLESQDFDAVIAATELPDGSAIDLLHNDDEGQSPPVVILDEELDAERVLAALRAGALDVFTPPFDLDSLRDVLSKAVRRNRDRAHEATRAERLRRLSSGMIRDRRELRQRVDLVCRDLVHAYRRLAEKVVAVH